MLEHVLDALFHIRLGLLDDGGFLEIFAGRFGLLQFQIHFAEVQENFCIVLLGVLQRLELPPKRFLGRFGKIGTSIVGQALSFTDSMWYR